jgi:hypothetical protein
MSSNMRHSGRINTGRKPPNELELTLRQKAHIPGPAAYEVSASPWAPTGGTISTAQTRTEFEWAMFRSNERPAPWAYEPLLQTTSGGRFNASNPPGILDLAIAKGRLTPGPGQYSMKGMAPSGGSFPRGEKLPDEIELASRRAALLPGPSDYSPSFSLTSGGTINGGTLPLTDLDWMIYRAKRGPGPASYRIKGIGDTGTGASAAAWAQAKKTAPRDKRAKDKGLARTL